MNVAQSKIDDIKLPKIIQFLRQKDYKFVRQLGRGACGVTIEIRDETIGENFVCKKYEPYFQRKDHPNEERKLFERFIEEIRILYKLNHRNVVRIFNYHIYEKQKTAYILMELVAGNDILSFLKNSPERASNVFRQIVDGFVYLESKGIIHRDIRPQNILVDTDGVAKIIDFGFGKKMSTSDNFDKSISLNWWCEIPNEFSDNKYDFGTEVYFVGKIFEQAVESYELTDFKYMPALRKMCIKNPDDRYTTFEQLQMDIAKEQFSEIEFSEEDIESYRRFSDSLSNIFTKIEASSTYIRDIEKIRRQLSNLYKNTMLEICLPESISLSRVFVEGQYYYSKKNYISVSTVLEFINLLNKSSTERQSIILNNIFSKLDAIERYIEPGFDDEVPF